MTITLKNGNVTAVVTTHGGDLVSFVDAEGTEYVWQGDPEHWSGQAPVLFPVCCTPLDKKIIYNGVEYPMGLHGFARDLDFEPIYMSKDKVVLEQRETEETLKMFPFCYSLKIEHTVTENGFSTVYTVKNLDKSEMTFNIGGHPGFNCPLRPEDGEFSDHSLIFDDADGAVASNCNGRYFDESVPKLNILKGTNEFKLNYPDFQNDAIIIENLPKKSLRLISGKTGRGFRFDFEGFEAIGFWTPVGKNSPFLCLEPWHGLPGNYAEGYEAKDKRYAITLAPDNEFTLGYSMEMIN